MSVTLHIERLVIDGFALGTHEGPLLQAAVEAEVRRLLAADGAFGAARNVALVRAAPIAPQAGADRLGTQIGQAIVGGIRR
jgi:hypothetical protein